MTPKSNSANKAYKRNTQNTSLCTQCFLTSNSYTRLTLLPCHSGAPSSSFYSKASSLQPWQCGRPPGICLHSVATSYLLQPTIVASVSLQATNPSSHATCPQQLCPFECTNNFFCFPQPSTMISQPVYHEGQAHEHI
jgi:hypothetical protein